MVYLVLFTLLFLCIIIYDLESNKQYKRLAFLIILVYLILLSGLSYRIGSDTVAYMEEYKLYLCSDALDAVVFHNQSVEKTLEEITDGYDDATADYDLDAVQDSSVRACGWMEPRDRKPGQDILLTK